MNPGMLQDRGYKELCCMLCKIMSVNQEIYHPLTLCHNGSISIVISYTEANKLPCSIISNFQRLFLHFIFCNTNSGKNVATFANRQSHRFSKILIECERL